MPFVIVSVGLMTFAAACVAWLGWKHDPRVHVPTPIAFVVAFVMLAVAAMVVLKSLGRGEQLEWLVVPVLLGMGVTCGWIGLYGQERSCGSRGPLFLPLPSCHTAFTGAALILLLMAALAAFGWWRRWWLTKSRKPPRMV
jgi:hypothetical protein